MTQDWNQTCATRFNFRDIVVYVVYWWCVCLSGQLQSTFLCRYYCFLSFSLETEWQCSINYNISLDYGDIVFMHAAPSTLKLLDTVYHQFTSTFYCWGLIYHSTHHCELYQNVGCSSLSDRREQHSLLFVYKALLGKLPLYLTSLLRHK